MDWDDTRELLLILLDVIMACDYKKKKGKTMTIIQIR